MRWIGWAFAPLVVVGLLGQAVGQEIDCGGGHRCSRCEHRGTLGAPPCSAHFYGMRPGCCEDPPTACDNAWAGYCNERAYWKSLWYRAGSQPPQPRQPTRATHRHRVRHVVTTEMLPVAKPLVPPTPEATLPPVPATPVPAVPTPPVPSDRPALPAEPAVPEVPALPQEPAAEPSALPPLPTAAGEETTWNWERLWQL